MSERTFESKLARLRASLMLDRRREKSRRWSARISRWRERLFCLRAEEVRVASESRRRDSWEVRVSRWRLLGVILRKGGEDGEGISVHVLGGLRAGLQSSSHPRSVSWI